MLNNLMVDAIGGFVSAFTSNEWPSDEALTLGEVAGCSHLHGQLHP